MTTFTPVCPYGSVHISSPVTPPIPSVLSQNVTGKSCMVCINIKEYAFLVTIRPLGSMRQGRTKLRTLHYQAR